MVSQKYTRIGGGDDPLTLTHVYQYSFYEKPWHRLALGRTRLECDFDIGTVTGLKVLDFKEDYKTILSNAPFFIDSTNVIEWANHQTFKGRVTFLFGIDYSLESLVDNGGPVTRLNAIFTNEKIAMLFKLTFGGQLHRLTSS